MKIRIMKFLSYKLPQWSAFPRLGLSSERELAHVKFLPNKNGHARTIVETKERNFTQSVHLTLCSDVHLVQDLKIRKVG
jgi:hypothetical protein